MSRGNQRAKPCHIVLGAPKPARRTRKLGVRRIFHCDGESVEDAADYQEIVAEISRWSRRWVGEALAFESVVCTARTRRVPAYRRRLLRLTWTGGKRSRSPWVTSVSVDICEWGHKVAGMTKTIFIAGALTGLGRAVAQCFHAQGWQVAATMRNPANGAELEALDGVKVFALDVTSGS